MTATVFNIQRLCTEDGPGIRSTVFFKGCNLRCAWCHNPESQRPAPEPMVFAEKCVSCGRCVGREEDPAFRCFHGAREVCGREMTLPEVLAEVLKDKAFYAHSGGGVTLSGGECMLRIDFLSALLRELKAHGVHTAVDTAGDVPYGSFERILADVDLFLYDVKCFDGETHRRFTGVDNCRILGNLANLLASGKRVWVRIPVVASVNDGEAEMQKIRAFLDEYGMPEKVELLPYHELGEHKYAALGREVTRFRAPSDTEMERLRAIFS